MTVVRSSSASKAGLEAQVAELRSELDDVTKSLAEERWHSGELRSELEKLSNAGDEKRKEVRWRKFSSYQGIVCDILTTRSPLSLTFTFYFFLFLGSFSASTAVPSVGRESFVA